MGIAGQTEEGKQSRGLAQRAIGHLGENTGSSKHGPAAVDSLSLSKPEAIKLNG